MPKTKIDIELLTEAGNGDRKAQHILYKYCFSLLMPVCFRYTKNEEFAREELSQAFVKIIFGLKKYNPEVVFDAWAKRITVNSVIDNYRKNKKHQYHDDVDDAVTQNKIKQHSNPTEDKIGYDEIIDLLDQVPEKSRTVFNLYIIEGYSHKEIADMLGLSEGTSKWHLSTARKTMQELIKKASKTLMSIFFI
jgi:RNA polymerase sigma-70 factor (ECF subfamily)